jgi:hypothetical protein
VGVTELSKRDAEFWGVRRCGAEVSSGVLESDGHEVTSMVAMDSNATRSSIHVWILPVLGP